jgi:hypothetical protein
MYSRERLNATCVAPVRAIRKVERLTANIVADCGVSSASQELHTLSWTSHRIEGTLVAAFDG